MTRGTGPLTALIALTLSICGSTQLAHAAQKKDATRKTAAPAAAARGASLDSAIAELKREYAAFQKDPDGAPLRSECDYFVDRPQSVTRAALFAALEKPIAGSDGRQTAYVKWQLLSALPETLDAEAAQRLAKAYQKAPMPGPRYGFSTQEKRKLDAAVIGARPQDDVQLTAKLEEAVERAYGADAPITAYRDELYRRLPAGRDKFFAGLRDAHERMKVAAQKLELVELLVEELQGWALSGDATKTQLLELAELVGRLRFEQSPPYYASAGVRRGRVAWVTKSDTLYTKSKLEALHKLLLEAAGMQPPPAPDDAPADDPAAAKPAAGDKDSDDDAAADDDDDKKKKPKDDAKDDKAGTDS